jgi:hypothetical protein
MLYRIEDNLYEPVAYGKELHDWGASHRPCPDCGVERGSQHKAGCDIEECLACSDQLITCKHYDDLEEVES